AQAATIAFDAATFEIWGALTHGATLLGIPQEVSLVPHELAAYLRERAVSVLFLTTALFNQVARSVPDAFATLRVLLFGGERVDPTPVRLLLQHGAPAQLLHVYGPTESTTFSTWYRVHAVADDAQTIPIGAPLANTQLYILDRQLQPVPIGVPGELYIGGDGLALGYHNRLELTAATFIANPFGEGRLYKTGDRTRYLPDGNIEFLGRLDNQVKLRGFRIELGEIEAVLKCHPDVREAVVICEDLPADKRLVAYIVAVQALTHPQLHQFLSEKLPVYMLPMVTVQLDALPLTPSGKVDRRALPAPDTSRPLDAESLVAPHSVVERQLVDLWKALLQLEQVGIHDNFFALGGHSLLTVQLVMQIKQQFAVDLPVKRFFERPTIAQLAAWLESNDTAPDQMSQVNNTQQHLLSERLAPLYGTVGVPGAIRDIMPTSGGRRWYLIHHALQKLPHAMRVHIARQLARQLARRPANTRLFHTHVELITQ
ncbi:MAG: non-ribosomal peptide synthetase, partial [Caldilineaceae bacterium]|nr:non-ribosomal peptide synthetase [Caldilineaceae bacterium]